MGVGLRAAVPPSRPTALPPFADLGSLRSASTGGVAHGLENGRLVGKTDGLPAPRRLGSCTAPFASTSVPDGLP